ncbi:hypothetical protein DPX16_3151 [Anabarilius grahami]|uniref:Uncharacterized protein n=1 Tax=Anabarilius grahami TaxID=495550 RepID=A0A3N0YZM2_ANAGA|nr:hypothetical protein DPX16_3151 [Anabarilius grahami]
MCGQSSGAEPSSSHPPRALIASITSSAQIGSTRVFEGLSLQSVNRHQRASDRDSVALSPGAGQVRTGLQTRVYWVRQERDIPLVICSHLQVEGPGSRLSMGRRTSLSSSQVRAAIETRLTCHSPAAFDLSERFQHFLCRLNIPARGLA